MISNPVAGYLPADFFKTSTWLSKKRGTSDEDGWYSDAVEAASAILQQLGFEATSQGRARTVANLLADLVTIRNKTKAHGAVGPDFFRDANSEYIRAIRGLITSCPLFQADWIHLSVRIARNTVKGVRLVGSEPRWVRDSEANEFWS
jgi:hypothetical protein